MEKIKQSDYYHLIEKHYNEQQLSELLTKNYQHQYQQQCQHQQMSNMIFFSPELDGLMIILATINVNFCQFYQLILDVTSDGLLMNIFKDKNDGNVRLILYLIDTESIVLWKIYELYGKMDLINYLDIVSQILFKLIHFQWINVLKQVKNKLETITFMIPLPKYNRVGNFKFQDIQQILIDQMIKNDGQFDKNNILTFQVYWQRILQWVKQYSNSYHLLMELCHNIITSTINYIKDELKIGNQINDDGQIIDPISQDIINRNDRDNVYYHMELSGTIYLFYKSILSQYIKQSGQTINPCTRTTLTIENLYQIGLSKDDLIDISNKNSKLINCSKNI